MEEVRGQVSEYIAVDYDLAEGVDARELEPIVRCRDCEYYVRDADPIDPGWPMVCELTGKDMVEPYGCCAWGERKDGEA